MRLLFGLALAVGCGGSHAVHGDASADGARADARADGAVDAMPDAMADAMPDAPPDALPPPSSRVWVVGDFSEPGHLIAAAFDDNAALPTTPTLVAALGSASLPTPLQGAPPQSFDVVASHAAFVANLRDPNVDDIYIADHDGQNPTLLVQGTAGTSITEVSLSPDGSKLVFVANTAADHGFDAYLVATSGTPSPVRISPPRAQGTWAFFILSWSPDSRFVGFHDEAYTTIGFGPMVVDTNAATPTPVAMVTPDQQGMIVPDGAVAFDAADRPYYRLRATSSSTFDLYTADTGGANPRMLVSRCSQYGLSTDGSLLTYSSDAAVNGTFDISVTAAATWNPVVIATTPTGLGGDTAGIPMHISDDHTLVTYLFADVANSHVEGYAARVDGQGFRRILNAPQGSNARFWGSDLTHDGKALYVFEDFGSGVTTYRVATSTVDGTPAPSIVPATGGNVMWFYVQPL